MKRILLIILTLTLLGCGGALVFYSAQDGRAKYDVDLTGVELPGFSKLTVDHQHNYVRSKGLPFRGAAVIDIDNDSIDELFLGGGVRQADGLFRLVGDRFVNISDEVGFVKQGDEATLAATVLDVDGNGFRDLLVSRESGIWLYKNNDSKFSLEKLPIQLPDHSVPLGVAVVDINGDNFFDFFVPLMGRRKYLDILLPDYQEKTFQPKLFVNNGDNTFSDVTMLAGIDAEGRGVQALFVDLDGDYLQDLVYLQDDGQIIIWQNLGNLLFQKTNHLLTNYKGLTMGLAPGDVNRDGYLDLFVTASGSTLPPKILEKILGIEGVNTSQILMENGTGLSFQDTSEKRKLAGYEFSRGTLLTDLNGDGREDLILAQNDPGLVQYSVPYLRLPGRVLLQNKKGEFGVAESQIQVTNKYFGLSPLVGDFNKDNRPDIVWNNLGGESQVFLSKPGENHFLKVQLPDSVKSLGARVTVKTLSGTIISRDYLVGKELCSDSTHALFIGLEKEKGIEVMVEYQNGNRDQTSGVLFNTMIAFE